MIKKLFFILSAIILTINIFAQSLSFEWTSSFGGVNEEIGSSITLDKSGNIYTTGWFYGTSDFDPGPSQFNLTSNGESDVFVSKLDPFGNLLWAKYFGGSAHEGCHTINTDESGNVYTAGTFNDIVDFDPGIGIYNLSSVGYWDIFINKLDSNGNFIWARSFGSNYNDHVYSFAFDSLGSLYLTGSFSGATDFDPGPGVYSLIPNGWSDVYICKIDSSGNFVWAKQIGGNTGDTGYALSLDNSGNVYTAGNFNGTSDFDPGPGVYDITSNGLADVFVLKLTSFGNFVWAKNFGGLDYETALDISIDSVFNVYVTGHFSGIGDYDPGPDSLYLTSYGGKDVFISKLNSNGELIWAKSFGGESDEVSYSIGLDNYGNVYSCGQFEDTVNFNPDSTNEYNLMSNGNNDLYISKLDSSGNFIWATSIGGNSSSDESANSMIIDSIGNVFVTGHYEDTTDFNFGTGEDFHIPKGEEDAFILKLNQCTQTYDSVDVTACDYYISSDGNSIWTSSGIYIDIVYDSLGCSNVNYVNLTIQNSSDSAIFDTACSSYISPSGSQVWFESGTYIDTIYNSLGCDSIITIYLEINDTYVEINKTACSNYNFNGDILTTTGTYIDTLTNNLGCDSIIILNLNIESVDISVSQVDNILTANANAAVYQWLDCSNGYTEIIGEINQSFTATVNGDYAVIITEDDCIDTSECYTVSNIGIEVQNRIPDLIIYPNPFKDELIIKRIKPEDKIKIFDILGKEQTFEIGSSLPYTINLRNNNAGIYFIRIERDKEVSFYKVVKQ